MTQPAKPVSGEFDEWLLWNWCNRAFDLFLARADKDDRAPLELFKYRVAFLDGLTAFQQEAEKSGFFQKGSQAHRDLMVIMERVNSSSRSS